LEREAVLLDQACGDQALGGVDLVGRSSQVRAVNRRWPRVQLPSGRGL
jgi:hypothetical protein